MALVKPIALAITAFDATQSNTFSFLVNGGDQVIANMLTIRKQTDNSIVYQNKIESYAFKQTVPPNVLENDNYYNFSFNTYNANEDVSEDSNVIQFRCLSTPTFVFTNFPSSNIIENNYYTFTAQYNQSQMELADSIKFYLYDSFDNVLSESEMYSGTQYFPLVISHTFNGFDNDAIYKVEAVVKTVNGMVSTTGKRSFTARYSFPDAFSLLDIKNDCEKNCVKLESNIIISDGIINPKYEATTKYFPYIEGEDLDFCIEWEKLYSIDEDPQNISKWTSTLLDVREKDNYVEWTKGFSIKSDFSMTIFMKLGFLGDIIRLGTETNGYIISIVREIPYGMSYAQDYLVLRGYVNGELKVLQKSNYVDLLNQQSFYTIWLRKVGDDYTIKLDVFERDTDYLNWIQVETVENYPQWEIPFEYVDGVTIMGIWNKDNYADVDNNLEYERATDITWFNEKYTKGSSFKAKSENMDLAFPIEEVRLISGLYDFMDFSSDVTYEYNREKRDWDYYTRLNCDFNDNLYGGNLNIKFSDIEYIRFKRRQKGTFDWLTIRQRKIETYDDLIISLEDYYVPTNYECEYALVPVLEGGIESQYISKSVKTKFIGVTVADEENVFVLKAQITYGGDIKNSPIGMYQPLSGLYPIIQKNSELNYYSGSLTATMMGYDFKEGDTFDRINAQKQTEDFCEFLTNNNAKIIKDWNGMIRLVRFNGSPSIMYNNTYGNSIPQVTGMWVEQGKFDNQTDLYKSGLVDSM